MIPNSNLSHIGNIPSESRVRMTFDPDSTAFLMSILTDLYKNPELAVIREYSLNALDSHRAANNTDPIEVELPSSLNMLFVVRDFGVGLSLDDVVNHLTKYGWSSKRGNNTEVGMLGLGFKSALSYTSQFTLVARKSGLQVTVLVTREDDGTGAVQVMDTCATDERDGVEIRIPVRNAWSFNDTAKRFFSFWEKGAVLVDGSEPKYAVDHESVIEIEPDIFLTKDGYLDYFVMGNIAYPAPTLFHNTKGYHVIARVPLGSIDFTPNREELMSTPRNKEAATDTTEYIDRIITKRADEAVASANTPQEAITLAAQWFGRVKKVYKFSGIEIPRSFYINYRANRTKNWTVGRDPSSNAEPQKNTVDVDFLMGRTQITGISTFSQDHRARVNQYCQANGITGKLLVCETQIGSPWTDDRVVPWETIRDATRKPRVPHTGPRVHHPRYRWLEGYQEINGDTLPATSTLLYVLRREVTKDNNRVLRNLNDSRDDITIALVAKGSEVKFLRDNPSASHVRDWVKTEIPLNIATLTDFDLIALGQGTRVDSLDNYFEGLTQVADQDLAAFARSVRGHSNQAGAERHHRLISINTYFNSWEQRAEVKFPRRADIASTVSRFLTKYPLLKNRASYTSIPTRQWVDYVNEHYHFNRIIWSWFGTPTVTEGSGS